MNVESTALLPPPAFAGAALAAVPDLAAAALDLAAAALDLAAAALRLPAAALGLAAATLAAAVLPFFDGIFGYSQYVTQGSVELRSQCVTQDVISSWLCAMFLDDW